MPLAGVVYALPSDTVVTKTVSLTATQLKSMFTTPVQLIAAGGAGTVIILDQAVFSFTYGTVAMTAGGVVRIQYTGQTNDLQGSNMVTVANMQGTANFVSLGPISVLNGNVGNAQVNTAIEITNATADFATGNSTAKVYVRYRVLTL